MFTSLITPNQIADNADRITYLPAMGVVVRGVCNQVLLSDLSSRLEAVLRLTAMGYQVSREWVETSNGASETYIHRAG